MGGFFCARRIRYLYAIQACYMSISLSSPLSKPALVASPRAVAAKSTLPLYLYAVTAASLFTIIGVLWDISWHKSIGRDKFLTPPHILIYLGAIFAGLFSGIQVLWTSFQRTGSPKTSFVKVWGIFYSPLGSLFCIWGAIAMLTSAPFDDWWHNAYGLDIKILSPPHTLLAMGMIFLTFGACVSISRYLNNFASGQEEGTPAQYILLRLFFIVCASTLLTMIYTLVSDYLHIRVMRSSFFYIAAAAVSLLFLPAFARALRMRWGMTAIAAGYFLIVGGSSWVLQLFPAEPKLGPILTHTNHFQSFEFPLLVVVPALVMDWLMQRGQKADWTKALLLAMAFVLVLFAVEYPFSGFLLESPHARNWFFGSETWYFGLPWNAPFRYKFNPNNVATPFALLEGLVIAIMVGALFAWISLRWGKWLQSIQR